MQLARTESASRPVSQPVTAPDPPADDLDRGVEMVFEEESVYGPVANQGRDGRPAFDEGRGHSAAQ